MNALRVPVVDVSDMLCAQALAVVAKALALRPPGASVDVSGAAPDVRRDLLIWAAAAGYRASDTASTGLRIERTP